MTDINQKNKQSRDNGDLQLIISQLDTTGGQPSSTSSRSFGLSLAAVFGFTGLATLAVAFPFIKPGFRKICLPYVPASDVQVFNVQKALKGSKGTVIDLGSGDGRLVSQSYYVTSLYDPIYRFLLLLVLAINVQVLI